MQYPDTAAVSLLGLGAERRTLDRAGFRHGLLANQWALDSGERGRMTQALDPMQLNIRVDKKLTHPLLRRLIEARVRFVLGRLRSKLRAVSVTVMPQTQHEGGEVVCRIAALGTRGGTVHVEQASARPHDAVNGALQRFRGLALRRFRRRSGDRRSNRRSSQSWGGGFGYPSALALASTLVLAMSGCAVINQGEVGVKRRAGKIDPEALQPGLVVYDVALTDIIKIPIRTVNREVKLSLPSKDGLNIEAEISILYRVQASKATEVVGTIGENYEDVVILSVFRSAAADTCAQFLAKDMYTASRKDIERGIQASMAQVLEPRGFVIEAVLLKSIQLPTRLTQAIELKLQADQDAQRMEFMLERERLEAERKQVEAEGIREAQKIIADGLTAEVIEWQTVQAFRALAASPNTKIIITDGDAPLLLTPDAAH